MKYIERFAKKVHFKRVILFTLFFAVASGAVAQTTFTAQAPRVVEVGETFRLIFTSNGEPSSFTPPSITDLDVLAGPTSSTMSSTKIINGKRTESFQVSYTYILQAHKEGKYTIPSASVVIDGKSYASSPVSIEVVKTNNKKSEESSEKSSTTITNQDIFMKISVSKGRVVTGEHLIATIKLYTRVPVAGFEDVRFPSFNGFWSQEIETPQNIDFIRENVNGQIYNSALLKKYLLLPQQSGSITIDAAELVCQVQIRANNSASRSIFDDFFDSYQTLRKRVYSAPVTVKVDPLPSGAPSSFNGAVGTFKMSGKLSKDSVNANEALSLMIDIDGTGNINLIEAPKPEIPASFELYDTKITDSSNKGAGGASGSKKFEYPLIARAPGEYSILPVLFTYYDIAKKEYVTLSTNEFKIKVGDATGVNSSSSGLPLGVNQQAVRSIADDIRYIHSGRPLLKRGDVFLFGSQIYFVILTLIFFFYLLLEKFLSKRVQRNRDVAGVRSRKANKIAKARLKSAGQLLKEGLYSAFYEELHRAVLGYVSDKLNLSLSDISRDKIEELLVSRGVKEENIVQLLSLIEQCEYARYAPDLGGDNMDKNYSKALDLISSMEL